MLRYAEIKESFLHLLFPHICKGCGSDRLGKESELCMHCLEALPETNFEKHPGNPVEKIFWGRLQLIDAAAQYYFTKESLLQHLLHQFKYKGDKELGLQLGRMMGQQLQESGRFLIDALIPLPLFPGKEKKRGFNQAKVLCDGIASTLLVPVLNDVIVRPQFTETQTKKGRVERWRNMDGKFELLDPTALYNKHVLLVDDVVTTGATLEACGNELQKYGTCHLSIYSLCVASH